ncbi:phosphonate metabolism transcriptional regulator PhnF [Stappia sp. F7233]|uniref:Phosphonate metabolism transcriptional regulator PhnF n=1 Tax=Stappia albiluteola TaxID=2758565 RepID=A0A839AGH3_9HYPH|nr:phosphonate metabolism transcriptional regulator PhnF [Stappia albiluteola]MBA5778960.1 phosphonate metabolism transcriptional regulator PhnF [Stappia albiluteola]
MTQPFDTVPVARGQGVALWRQIADELKSDILSGALGTEEGRLPTEKDLAARFGVNRHTVRRAIAELTAEGILRADQGRGTFVSERLITYPISSRTRFSEIIAAQAREPFGKLLASSEEPATAAQADLLGVEAGTPLIRIETLSVADEVPLIRATSWFPKALCPGLVADYAQTGSTTKSLARAGVTDYRRKETRILADLARVEDAQLLNIAIGQPLLITEALNVDPSGKPTHFTRTRIAAERVQLIVESL